MKLRKEFIFLIKLFLVWRIYLAILAFVAIAFVPLGNVDRFLGGGSANYQLAPEIFSWANFDGEHYLSIAIIGYKEFEQAFFPVYPKIIGVLAGPFDYDFFTALLSSTLIGLTLSSLFIFLSIILLWELVRLDYSEKVANWTVALLLVFPTSFYLVSLYNESLFLFLSLGSFYAARKKQWWLAGLLGGIAAGTRVFGVLIFPALAIELWHQKAQFKSYLWLLFIPAGLMLYMGYLWYSVGDPIAFFHLQKIVGEQRSSGFVVIFQTYFRYIKMIATVDPSNPIYQTVILEFISGILFLILPIYGLFKKIRYSYIFYAVATFLVASIQGSFSSVPRYVLVFFPSFIALALFIENKNYITKFILVILSVIVLSIETMMFLRGYWIA